MSSVRKSKFRHVFGQPVKKDTCYDCIRITKGLADGRYSDVNTKFIAICTENAGGAAFLVLPLSKTGRVDREQPIVCGHSGPILDIQWCPHNENVIATASDDCTVKLWHIPDGGLTHNLDTPMKILRAHRKRVNLIAWHPTASNVLLSTCQECKVYFWKIGTSSAVDDSELYFTAEVPAPILSISFNYDGSKVVTTEKAPKDKKIRVYRSRNMVPEVECDSFDSAKPAKAIFLRGDRVFCTGFSMSSERQYRLYDEELKLCDSDGIDKNNGVLFPYYDWDTDMLFLVGKGDSYIRFYEIPRDEEKVYYLNMYQAKDPQRGVCCMPKRGLNVGNNEIARFFKLHNSGLCEIINFIVPRKSETFQEDLYPDTAAPIPSATGDEWMFQEKDCPPVMMSMKDGCSQGSIEPVKMAKMAVRDQPAVKIAGPPATAHPPASSKAPPPQKHMVHDHNHAPPSEPSAHPAKSVSETPAPVQSAPAGPPLPAGFDAEKLLKDVEDLKAIVKQQDKKIAALEQKLEAIDGEGEMANDEETV